MRLCHPSLLFFFLLLSMSNAAPKVNKKHIFKLARDLSEAKRLKQPISCVGCIALAAPLATIAKLTPTEGIILWFAKMICSINQPMEVCDGITQQFRGEFFYVFRRLANEPSKICAALIPGCVDPSDPDGEGWNIPLPPLPRSLPSPSASSSSSISPPNVLKVLQITDIHIDFHYESGSEAECADPVCCRGKNSRNWANPSVSAGFWGTIGKCDIPYRTMENMLKHISDTQHIDYIMVGGDIIDHYDWKYSWEETLEVLQNVSSLFKTHFPTTPIYWALGNHEGVPVNSFAPHSVNEQFWPVHLYDQLTEMNKPWIKEDGDNSSRFRGSWSTLVTDRLRLISINTGFCINTNFFLYLNQSDPDGTMTWFVDQLTKAELSGENVHILAHIPPGYYDCLEGWSRNYYRVIQRFSSIITGQFFGHVHYDYFTLFYEDMNDVSSEPIGVAYVSPSASTFDYLNPGYRVYTLDAENTFKIIDHDNYYADLSFADENTEPEWKLLYSARQEYNITDLSPKSWNAVADNIFTNATLTDRFFQLAYRTESPRCDSSCRHYQLCLLRSGHHNDDLYCPPNHLETNRVY
ncbi:asm-1 [Pristionchus pacificus]|uniref:Sphingomyelin phosphodiesterase n=1 Tax=Pristionchus pacificus TaxID=54126 RepID=A0A2A6D3Q4_PRIPA|nr:asm-1 [Pristionchus pacificus]|eukprot:PDM84926.1 asm-1 [Pristionchus pacificus]